MELLTQIPAVHSFSSVDDGAISPETDCYADDQDGAARYEEPNWVRVDDAKYSLGDCISTQVRLFAVDGTRLGRLG